MKENKQRTGAQQLDFKLVDLYKSESNKSSTLALHFDTEETNQFCDFTEAVLEIIAKSGIKHGSVSLFTPHTTTAVVINESETGYINDFKKKIVSNVKFLLNYKITNITELK